MGYNNNKIYLKAHCHLEEVEVEDPVVVEPVLMPEEEA